MIQLRRNFTGTDVRTVLPSKLSNSRALNQLVNISSPRRALSIARTLRPRPSFEFVADPADVFEIATALF